MTDTTEQVVEHSFLVQINYKSGHSIKAWFDKFDVSQNGGDITRVEWNMTPDIEHGKKILVIGIDNIESIVQLEVKDRT